MMLMERYQKAVEDLLAKVRATQTETIQKAGQLIADSVANGGKIYLAEICHSIQMDFIYRGGGPIFYKHFKKEEHWESMKAGDVLVVSSVSGRTQHVVDMAWEAMERGITVIAFTSMEYATQVDPVHPSGKKLYEFVTLAVDNCAPAAEAMLEVEGIEARFAAASCVVENLLAKGITPGILKSANVPGGADYNKTVVEPNYDKFGW